MSKANCNMKNMDAEKKQLLIESLSTVINEQRQILLQQILAQRTRYLTVVLEDIYQPQNASAVIRTAECLGLQEMHIIENKHEYQVNPKVVQGASKWMEINRYKDAGKDNTTACLKKLKNRGYKIVAMTLREDSIDLNTIDVDQKLALCFGSEEPGLTDLAHELADEYIKIPMCGFTQSFNLSVSAGICLNHLATKMRESDLNWQLSEDDTTDLYVDWLSKSTPTGKVLLDKFIKSNSLES
jgi:tRNA (guanosine-2'-O-)-methyltransferase